MYFMKKDELLQVLQEILEEYRAIYFKDSPITWISRLDKTVSDSVLILCGSSGDVFHITVKEMYNYRN